MGEMIKLALPVVLTYVGFMTMGLVDILMVGHLGATPIGAVGVGSSLYSWFLIFGIGLLTGMDYPISHAFGAGKTEEGHQTFVQGVLLGFFISIPLTAILLAISKHLSLFALNPDVTPETAGYLGVLAYSLLPALVFTAGHRYLQAMGAVRPPMIILLLANILNVVLNYALIFGHFGAPRMLVPGSAVATLVSRIFMMAAIGFYIWDWDRKHEHHLEKFPFRYDAARMRALIKLGTPSALQMVFEVGVFAMATVLAARLSSEELAAHQIVLNTASFTFMVPLGVSSATAVMVGQAVGRNEPHLARAIGWRGFALGTAFMAFSASMMLLFPHAILSIYSHDVHVIAIGQSLLWVAALFQLSDGAQCVGTGALRGIGDTHTPMVVNLCGHWLVGLPLGVFLCFGLHWGVQGLWIGLSSGLTLVAGGLLYFWRKKSQLLAGPLQLSGHDMETLDSSN